MNRRSLLSLALAVALSPRLPAEEESDEEILLRLCGVSARPPFAPPVAELLRQFRAEKREAVRRQLSVELQRQIFRPGSTAGWSLLWWAKPLQDRPMKSWGERP